MLFGLGSITFVPTLRRALIAAGWVLAAAHRRPIRNRSASALPALRRWHIVLGAVLGAKALQAGLRALHSLVWGGEERRERRRLQAMLRTAIDYKYDRQGGAGAGQLGWRAEVLSRQGFCSRVLSSGPKTVHPAAEQPFFSRLFAPWHPTRCPHPRRAASGLRQRWPWTS